MYKPDADVRDVRTQGRIRKRIHRVPAETGRKEQEEAGQVPSVKGAGRPLKPEEGRTTAVHF